MRVGVGQSAERVEDGRLPRGRGRYTDDINLPDQLHGCVVRSPHPHARIAGVDTALALAAPGVAAVFTGADVEADGLGTLPSLVRGAASAGSRASTVPPRYAPTCMRCSPTPHRPRGRASGGSTRDRTRHRSRARELGIDRVELRRRNLIPPEAMPFRTGLAYRYDCGEFGGSLASRFPRPHWAHRLSRRRPSRHRIGFRSPTTGRDRRCACTPGTTRHCPPAPDARS